MFLRTFYNGSILDGALHIQTETQNKKGVPVYIRKFFCGTWSNIFHSNKKEKSLKIKLANQHLYSNSILNAKYLGLDYSNMAKWVYHVCKTKLGFTPKMQK